jgi:hypothetical protein
MGSILWMTARTRRLLLPALALGAWPATALAQNPMGFVPLPPCRVWDTRTPPGPSGGPKLTANTERCFPVRGSCGVDATARAVVLNLTATAATDLGDFRAYPGPGGGTPPLASVLNFLGDGAAGANNVIVPIGTDGRVCIRVDMPIGSVGQVHSIADTTGYFTYGVP